MVTWDLSHLINLIKVFKIDAKVKFLSPVNAQDFSNRKSMTKFLQMLSMNNIQKILMR